MRGFMPRTFIISEVKMENNELLTALQNLKKKIDSYKSTQASIEKLKSRQSELTKKKE